MILIIPGIIAFWYALSMGVRTAFALALLALLGGPALAAESASVPMTVTVVEPALSLSIQSAVVEFGAAVHSDSTYTSLQGLEITVEDQATQAQATSGWHLVATGTVLSSEGGTLDPERMTFHRGHLTSVEGSPGAGPTPPVEPAGGSQALSGPVRILQSAGPNDSKGSFRVVWAPEVLTLAIPGSTTAGTYTGLLSLTLSRGL